MSKSFLNTPGLPLGLRNNNPGNLRPGDNWQGMIGTNGGFLVFQNIAYGIRALATDLGNKIMLRGLTTLKLYLYVYAPPSENDTEKYITRMVNYTGFGANETIPHTENALMKLIRGHINVELGEEYSDYISDSDIREGLAMINSTLKEYFHVNSVGTSSDTGLIVGFAVLIAASAAYWYIK